VLPTESFGRGRQPRERPSYEDVVGPTTRSFETAFDRSDRGDDE
jgi:hypothetical protein